METSPSSEPKTWPPQQEDSRVSKLYARLMQVAIQEDEDASMKPEAPKVRRKTTGQDSHPPIITKLSTKVLAPQVQRIGDRASVSRRGLGNRTELSFNTKHMAPSRSPAAPPVSNFSLSPPPVPLQNRAVHPYFLRELLRTGICPVSRMHTFDGTSNNNKETNALFAANRYAPQANWTCGDFVDFAVKPSTDSAHMSFVQALLCDAVSLPWVGRKEQGQEGRFSAKDIPGSPMGINGKVIYGPSTYFVSFSYQYQFHDLVHAILAHYESLPEALAAAAQGTIAPVYYWLSIFAVNKNHGDDIRKNPDGDPEPAIQRSKAVLLACKPWYDPAALSRAWCIFELLTALDAGIEIIALNLDRDISLNEVFPEGSIREAKEKFTKALSEIDIQKARTTNEIDSGWLCSLVEKRHPGGFATVLPVIQKGLKPALMGALLTLVLKREVKDYDLAMKLVTGGEQKDDVHMQWGSAFIGGPTQGGDAAAAFFAIALGKSNNTVRLQELVLDPDVSPSHPSGSQGLLLTRPWNHLLSQEVPTWAHQGAGGATGAKSGGGAMQRQGSERVQRESSVLTPLSPSPTSRNFESASPIPQLSLRNLRGGTAAGGRGLSKVMDPDWTLGGWAGSHPSTASSKHASPSAPQSSPVPPKDDSSTSMLDSSLSPNTNAKLPLTKKQAEEARAKAEALAISSRIEVTSKGAAQLSLALSLNPGGSLMTLSLSHNRSIEGQGASTIFRALRGNFSLKSLFLRDCSLDPSCAKELGKALRTNVSLTMLDLGQNEKLLSWAPAPKKNAQRSDAQLSPCHHIAWGLPRCGLRDLRMDSTGLDSFQACILAKGLSSCTSLVRLDLSNNHINGREVFDSPPDLMADAVVAAYSEQEGMRADQEEEGEERLDSPPSPHMVHRYRKVESSSFSTVPPVTSAARDCAALFARGLAGSSTLQALFLGGNLLRSEGVVALSSALCNGQYGAGRSLRMLVLRDNDLGLEAGLALSNILSSSSSFPLSSGPLLLSCLDLSVNPYIGDVGARELASGLRCSSSLIELRMEGVGMTSIGATAIAEAVGKGAKAMRRLELSDNLISNAGAESFATALSSSSENKLVELRLERNGIGVEGRLAIVSAIQTNRSCSLKHLSLVGNTDSNADPKDGARLLPNSKVPTPAEMVAATLKPLASASAPDEWPGLILPEAPSPPSKADSKVIVAPMSKAEQLLAQALHVGRLLKRTRGLQIY